MITLFEILFIDPMTISKHVTVRSKKKKHVADSTVATTNSTHERLDQLARLYGMVGEKSPPPLRILLYM